MSATVVAISNSHVFEGELGAMPMKNGGERRGGKKGREKVFILVFFIGASIRRRLLIR